MTVASAQPVATPRGTPSIGIRSEPAWDIARLFPDQGRWTPDDYLALLTNRLVEFSHGVVEVLPVPTDLHQAIVFFLCASLHSFITPRSLGTVRLAPLRLRLGNDQFREPDVLFIKSENDARRGNAFWSWADLVMEVVSDDNRQHDLETKRREYARSGIPEYWIIDPLLREVAVLTLAGDHYDSVGVHRPGERAASVLLPGFDVDVAAVFMAN